MKKLEITDEIESLGLQPCVTLVVADEFGNIKLLEHIGEGTLGEFLKSAANTEDNPVSEDNFLLDCRGQEIYTLADYEYFKTITGFFLSISRENIQDLITVCNKEGLKFTFIVSY